MHKFVMRCLTW